MITQKKYKAIVTESFEGYNVTVYKKTWFGWSCIWNFGRTKYSINAICQMGRLERMFGDNIDIQVKCKLGEADYNCTG